MKWVVFATAPDQIMAEIWVQLVRSEGIPCRLQPGDTTNFLGVSATPVRLMTLERTPNAPPKSSNAGMRSRMTKRCLRMSDPLITVKTDPRTRDPVGSSTAPCHPQPPPGPTPNSLSGEGTSPRTPIRGRTHHLRLSGAGRNPGAGRGYLPTVIPDAHLHQPPPDTLRTVVPAITRHPQLPPGTHLLHLLSHAK